MGCKNCCGGCFRDKANDIHELRKLGLVQNEKYYVIKASMREGNPAFKAILYTSLPGGWASLHYSDDCFEINDHVRMKVITEVTDMSLA